MKLIRIFQTTLAAAMVMAVILTGCGNNARSGTDETAEDAIIPSFVKNLVDTPFWYPDTICVADGKPFYWVDDIHSRTNIIFDDKQILLENPTLYYDSVSPKEDYRFNIHMAEKMMTVDFNDPKSVKAMQQLDILPPTFCRFREDTLTGYGDKVLFSLCIDFMRPDQKHAGAVNTWMAQMTEQMAKADVDDGPNQYVEPRAIRTQSDKKALLRRSADCYFAVVREDHDIDDYPINYFIRNISLRAWHHTDKFVTMLKYIYDYNGGAHGYFTEQLVSYNPAKKRVVEWDDLFRPACRGQVVQALCDAIVASPKYKATGRTYDEKFLRGMFTFDERESLSSDRLLVPRPGLGEKGVVFSFQPYELSGFADGTFHFTLPYQDLKPYLTDEAKQLLAIED